jgi:hypothetical protein
MYVCMYIYIMYIHADRQTHIQTDRHKHTYISKYKIQAPYPPRRHYSDPVCVRVCVCVCVYVCVRAYIYIKPPIQLVVKTVQVLWVLLFCEMSDNRNKGGREGGRKGGREGGREGEREGGRKGGERARAREGGSGRESERASERASEREKKV